MRVVFGADHAGFELKEAIKASVDAAKFQIEDVGTFSTQPVDYPDIAAALTTSVLKEPGARGVLICGSGVGASVAANKVRGIRAAICHDTYSAHQGVEHDDMNVLVLGGRVIGVELARELVRAFLNAQFTHEERHERRLKKVLRIESANIG